MRIKKIFLSLFLVISFIFLSGFSTLAESEVKAQEYPSGLYKATYERFQYIQENARTHEYMVYYVVPFVINETISENDYYFINNIDEVFRKGINRNTNSYILEDQAVVNGQTWFYVRVTVLTSLLDSKYPDGMIPLFENDTTFYINISYSDANEYERGFNDGYNKGYEEGRREGIRIDGRAPDNDYNFNNFGEPIIGTAYANRLYYSTGLGRVPVISNELFVGYNNIMIGVFYGVFFYDSNGNEIGDIIINCGNTSSCENTEGYGEKFDYMANSIDYAYNFAVYLNKYDIDYENVEFVELQFITKQFPTAGWHEHFKNDLYFSFNYEHSFLRINLYQQGYNDGFAEGEEVGRGIATREAYELGYEDGYKEGLKKANVDPFIANFDKWIVPAIIIVMLLGGYFAIRRQKTEDI